MNTHPTVQIEAAIEAALKDQGSRHDLLGRATVR
jgi:hypothetical protein